MMGLDAIPSLRFMVIPLAARCHSGKTDLQAIALSSHSLFADLRIIRRQSIQRVHSGFC